jgi:hypothetical protein
MTQSGYALRLRGVSVAFAFTKREGLLKAISYLAAALSTLVISGSASAGAPPVQLHNKTIIVSWSQTNVWRRLSNGQNGSSNVTMEGTLYISSAGRPFTRIKSTAGTYNRGRDVPPDESSGRFRFDGNIMTSFMGREGLLWRITVRFEPSFTGCDATINVAREGRAAKVTGVDGDRYENLSTRVGAASCSMRDGNAFAR